MKGKAIWILGFFSFLLGAIVVNAIIMWFNLGPQATFTPPLLGGLTGAIPVYVYFLISMLLTLVFLGMTSHKIVSDLSNEDELNAVDQRMSTIEIGLQDQQKTLESVDSKAVLIEEGLEYTRRQFSKGLSEQGDAIKRSVDAGHESQLKMLSEQEDAIKRSVETGRESQLKMLDGVQGRIFLLDEGLTGVKKEFLKGLNEQGDAIRGVNNSLVNRIDSQTDDIKGAVAKELMGVDNALTQLKQRDEKTAGAVAKQMDEIARIKSKVEKLERELAKPKQLLTSQSNVKNVKGIGADKAAKLKEIEVMTVGDLVMADPKVVAEKLVSSDKTVEKLQGRAQLSMVPGVNQKDIFLLEELNINDRRSLAEQDPVELGKKINAIFKVSLARGKVKEADKPNFEEIDSWVKFAKA